MISSAYVFQKLQQDTSKKYWYSFQLSGLGGQLNGHVRKITVTDLKGRYKPVPHDHDSTLKQNIDFADVLQTILSRQLPHERFDGILGLWLLFRQNIPNKEMENALVNWFLFSVLIVTRL